MVADAITLAIIGTAGRREDGVKMTPQLYFKMVARVGESIEKLRTHGKPIIAVSGGAAWSDHVAVSLYLMDKVDGLVLHLPAAFEDGKFVGRERTAGGVANYYHRLFTKKMGKNTLDGISRAIAKGAEVHVHEGFKARNAQVAKTDYMVAFTWGSGNTPKDGGTAHTWRLSKATKLHIPLSSL